MRHGGSYDEARGPLPTRWTVRQGERVVGAAQVGPEEHQGRTLPVFLLAECGACEGLHQTTPAEMRSGDVRCKPCRSAGKRIRPPA